MRSARFLYCQALRASPNCHGSPRNMRNNEKISQCGDLFASPGVRLQPCRSGGALCRPALPYRTAERASDRAGPDAPWTWRQAGRRHQARARSAGWRFPSARRWFQASGRWLQTSGWWFQAARGQASGRSSAGRLLPSLERPVLAAGCRLGGRQHRRDRRSQRCGRGSLCAAAAGPGTVLVLYRPVVPGWILGSLPVKASSLSPEGRKPFWSFRDAEGLTRS